MAHITIMNGKELSEKLVEQDIRVVRDLRESLDGIRPPTLVIITVGENDASQVYVRNKLKLCEQVGISVTHQKFKADVSRELVAEYIKNANYSPSIDGIIIQQPVPLHLKGLEYLISPDKDVDGFTSYNIGTTLTNAQDCITACTPKGIMEFFDQYAINLAGKVVCIIGRSNIVGKPLIGLLLNKDATVISCNSYTPDLKQMTAQSDVIISAIGKAKYIDSSFITSKCNCIIDVGINRDENGKLCGDVDFEDIINFWEVLDTQNRYITPVPKGVGPMTVYELAHNTVNAYVKHIDKHLKRKG